MSKPWRLLLIGVAVVAGVALLVALGDAIRSLGAIENALSDPGTIAESVIDELLASVPEEPALRPDDPLIASRQILVTANINERTAKNVAARLLYMDALDHKRPIDLYLSTQGGWVDSAFTIIDTMQLIDAPVNTWAIGGCYSSGALILAAGTGRRFATPNAVLMIHASLDEETKESYSYERLALQRYERIWKRRAQLPEAWFPMVGGEEYYLSPQEALDFKLIDEIRPLRNRNVASAPSGRRSAEAARSTRESGEAAQRPDRP
ncbi:MAG: ATP-dependent Clp protease proteolytic subunit [Deltaproteobacteria bacterium]|nr:ATP-dependent Clp protease proteolytic subunit [Deltaproteobacteria bacterium]